MSEHACVPPRRQARWAAGMVAPGSTSPLVRVRSVTVLGGFEVRLGFTDGSECTVDLEPCLRGPGIEVPTRDPALLAGIGVDPELGTIVWPNGEDIAPEVLYEPAPPGSTALQASGRR